jgi:riboflavin kinase/FMN adenylyltransferase
MAVRDGLHILEGPSPVIMRIIRHYKDVPDAARGAVVAIGNFDGVHRGHQAVIGQARALAADMGVPVAVLVFEPHPRQYFAPDAPFFRLSSFRAKVGLLAENGVDITYALPFDKHMASLTAPEFVSDVLVKGLGAVHVVVGYDFCFGKGRAGDITALRYMGDMEGFGVTVVSAQGEGDGEVFSSTRVREALSEGRVEDAARLLGRPWFIEGRVLDGDKRGRTIGFPTANVQLDGVVPPKFGVYAVEVEIEDGPHKGAYKGVANLGKRPTFNKEDVLLEVNLFDFAGDIYGAHLRVSLMGFIRAEQKFDSLDALKAQIAADADTARSILASPAA